MTTRGEIKQRQPVDYSHLEPLPDPPREPDMNRRRRTRALDGIVLRWPWRRAGIWRGLPASRCEQRGGEVRS